MDSSSSHIALQLEAVGAVVRLIHFSHKALSLSVATTLCSCSVNSASGTVSSFHILNGVPVFVDQEHSGGAFPIAVAEHNDFVYVLNAGGNGAVVGLQSRWSWKAPRDPEFVRLSDWPQHRRFFDLHKPQRSVACGD